MCFFQPETGKFDPVSAFLEWLKNLLILVNLLQKNPLSCYSPYRTRMLFFFFFPVVTKTDPAKKSEKIDYAVYLDWKQVFFSQMFVVTNLRANILKHRKNPLSSWASLVHCHILFIILLQTFPKSTVSSLLYSHCHKKNQPKQT